MQQRPLGPGAGMVSAVGFGGMHLSLEERPPEELAIQVVHAALDRGVRLVDTADVYCRGEGELGHNERLVAAAVRSWKGPRDEVIIATKGGMDRKGTAWVSNGRPEHLRRACDRSLKALGVERIALYQLHRPDPDVPFMESVEALAELVSSGKIQWLGLSNVTVGQVEAARRVVPVISVQNRLSPFFREALESGVVEFCGREGIGFLAYSPTGGGRLNLKLRDHPVVGRVASRHGISPHAVVLAWVLQQGPTVIPIPSARTVAHAVDSAGAAMLELAPDDIAAITEAEFSTAR